MKTTSLNTDNPNIKLIEPDVDRDATIAAEWLNGALGRTTMLLMGNPKAVVDEILPTTIDKEAKRVKDFIERGDQLNWMIEFEGKVVGSAWVDIVASEDLPAPSVHIMIGDPAMRGKRVGTSAITAILNYLREQGNSTVYSRHTTSNEGADKLLKALGFEDFGETYTRDGVEFQNLKRYVAHD